MLCPNGHDNPAEARFCATCGVAIPPPRSVASPVVPPLATLVDVPSTPPAAVSQEMKVGIIAGTVFVPPLGIIMGIIYMNDANPEKQSAGRLWLYVGAGAFLFQCILVMCIGMFSGMMNARW